MSKPLELGSPAKAELHLPGRAAADGEEPPLLVADEAGLLSSVYTCMHVYTYMYVCIHI